MSIREALGLYRYSALIVSNYDGDSFRANIDLGHGVILRKRRLRLWAVDTPELRGPELAHGRLVRDAVRSLVVGETVMIRTYLDPEGADRSGKFGRLLAEVLVWDDDRPMNLNQWLVDTGQAKLNTYGDLFTGWSLFPEDWTHG